MKKFAVSMAFLFTMSVVVCAAQQKAAPGNKTVNATDQRIAGCKKMKPVVASTAPELAQAETQFCIDTANDGVEGWMRWYTESSVELQEKPLFGKAAIRDGMKDLLATPGLIFYWCATQAEVFPSGNKGFTTGRYHIESVGKDGKTAAQDGTYLTVWVKQKDGSWKVQADTGAADGPKVAPKAKVVPVEGNESKKKG